MQTSTLRALALTAALAAALPALAAMDPAPAAAAPAARPEPPPYGPNITTEQAQVVMAKAEAEAKRLGAQVGIAIVETNGSLVMFERMTGANYNAVDGAPLKARSAALWRRSTSSWMAGARESAASATFPNVVASNGGEMIVYRGQVIGAIGISGNATHEANIARTAAAALQ